MQHLDRLKVFMQVAQSLSFVEAGRVLGLTASAVGKTIARLEQQLAIQLFQRSTRSMILTLEGQVLLQQCAPVFEQIDVLEKTLFPQNQLPSGRLKISLPVVSSLLLPILSNFRQQFPEIVLDLDFSDRLVDLFAEGFDLVLRTGEPSDSSLHARKLAVFHSVVVASPKYLAKFGIPLKPEDLVQHRCFHYRLPHSGKLEKWALQGMNPAHIPVSMVCNNIDTRLYFSLEGQGISYLPSFVITDYLQNGQLVSLVENYNSSKIAFYLLWPSTRYLAPRARAFIDFFSQNMVNSKAKSTDVLKQ